MQCIRKDLTEHIDDCFKDHLHKLCDGARQHHTIIEKHENLINALEETSISQKTEVRTYLLNETGRIVLCAVVMISKDRSDRNKHFYGDLLET